MSENQMTIHHNGESLVLELTEKDAERFAYFVRMAKDANPPEGLSDEDIQRRKDMRAIHLRPTTLGDITREVTQLDADEIALVSALVDIIRVGSNAHLGGWIYEVVTHLLYIVTLEGPFAANDGDPRATLSSVAHDIAEFWNYVEDAHDMKDRHPRLFPAEPAEPEADAETTPTRKGRKKAA